MRYFTLMTALALSAMSAVAFAADLFVADKEKFRIEFPVPPTKETRTVQANTGPVTMSRFVSRGDGLRASVSVVTFSRSPFSQEEVQYGLEQSSARQVAQVKGTLVNSRALKLAGHTGMESLIAFGPPDKDYRYRVRTYYAGSRQYQVSLVGTAAETTSQRADDFLDSFSLSE